MSELGSICGLFLIGAVTLTHSCAPDSIESWRMCVAASGAITLAIAIERTFRAWQRWQDRARGGNKLL